MATLQFVLPKGKHLEYELNSRTDVLIGRGESNDIDVPDMSISRRHAELRLNGCDYVIRDLNSANGVYVNGERVVEALLCAGDNLRIGSVHALLTESRSATEEPHYSHPKIQNVFGWIAITLAVTAIAYLLQSSVVPELAQIFAKTSNYAGFTNPYTQYESLRDETERLKDELKRYNDQRISLQEKLNKFQLPPAPQLLGTRPPFWHPFDRAAWDREKQTYDSGVAAVDKAKQEFANWRQELENLTSQASKKEAEIQNLAPSLERAKAAYLRKERLDRVRTFIQHFWRRYIATPLHILLCLSLLSFSFRVGLRIALINGWLGVCQVTPSNENLPRIEQLTPNA